MLYIYCGYIGRLFLGCTIFVARFIIIKASREIKMVRLSYRKKYTEEFVSAICYFFDCTPSSLYLFVAFFVYSLPLSKLRACGMVFINIYSVATGGMLCDDVLLNGRKYENYLQFNTSWLSSLRTWYYFELFCSFSCSGYDLPLIIKSHSLNYYLLLQKFLLKTKIYNSLLAAMIAGAPCPPTTPLPPLPALFYGSELIGEKNFPRYVFLVFTKHIFYKAKCVYKHDF